MKIIILIIVISATLYSQNVWEVRFNPNPKPDDGIIKKFEVVDSNNIYFISNSGLPNYLYKSINQGKSWELIKHFNESGLSSSRDIDVFDSLIYISFYGGIILKSTDYGKTFEKIDVGYNNFIYDLIMFDENIGIANMPVKVYKTSDGWENSDTIQLPFILNLHVIKKYNDSLAYGILSNFGKKLEESKEPNKMYLYQTQFFKYNFLNDEFITTNFPDMPYLEIEFTNDSVFYLCGVNNQITGGSGHDAVFKSTDAGKTWRTILDLYADWNKIPNTNNHKKPQPFGLQDIAFKNDSVGVAVGQFGKILYTYDGGESWFYEQKLPRIIDSLSPPTMLVTYAGDRAIIGDFTGAIHTLEVDNLDPKPEDTLTISGKIISEDSLAITHIPIRLNSNRITMTDEEGNYKFTKLSSGSYTVVALNKYYDGGNPSYHYEPFLYSPVHTFDLKSDTNGIDFLATNIRGSSEVTGSIILNGNGLAGVEVLLLGDNLHKDTTNSDGFFTFENIGKWINPYKLSPNNSNYNFAPEYYELYVNENIASQNFEASPITSVEVPSKYQVRANVLYSEDVAGLEYRVVSLSGSTIKSGALLKELDLTTFPTGTYILNIVKGEEIIFTHKFQVVK